MPNLPKIRNGFEQIADQYDRHAALEQEVFSRLLERTSFHRVLPGLILDLGCGTGSGSAQLKQQFRKARVIGMDTSMAMLSRLKRRSGILKPLKGVCGDIGALPFASRCADMLFSSLTTHWCPDPMSMFAEFRRVLKPEGMLLFSTLGPATLQELRDAWAVVDPRVEPPEFPDLMEIGDALVSAGFREPVMDMDVIRLSYRDLQSLLAEIEATGNSMLIRGWERRAGQEDALEQAWAPYMQDGKYLLSFEIIYGIAFGPQDGQPVKTAAGDVATFSVDALRRGRKVP
ncbi:MAG: methyltransferase domain-containing protein [Xanthomonadales bacterium]|nr:methyltransferase domain-containing protein [Gammaproteobacteria bacterium]NNK51183.1 methyltransferase domain-containing protein [Xanthomonadales bacterium]